MKWIKEPFSCCKVSGKDMDSERMLGIDKGSQRTAVHSGTCIHNYGNVISYCTYFERSYFSLCNDLLFDVKSWTLSNL